MRQTKLATPLKARSRTLSKTVAGKVSPSLCQLIARQPLFKGLKPHQLGVLAGLAMEMQFAPGEYIFRRQDPANRFYVILEGKVEIELALSQEDLKPFQIAGPGDYLGWTWLFEPYSFYTSARAIKPTRAIFFYGTMLRQRCEDDHDLGYEVVKRVAESALKRAIAFQQAFQRCTVLKVMPGSFLVSTRNEAPKYRKRGRV
jgi:CRP/FNR family transcriptional regulator, cyclic AMP receptor protein